MQFFQRFKWWKFSKGRLEAFSDAVFAIVMTLLVLELKIPHGVPMENTAAVWAALKDIAPIFFSWVVSFFFVAIIWLHHHQIMNMSTESDYGVIWINILLLFFISFLPFPTALMGEHLQQPLIVTIWGLNVCFATLVQSWLYSYCTRNFLSSKFDKATTKKNVRLSLGVPLIYLVAALLAWVSVYISLALYFVMPFLFLLPLDREVGFRE